MSASWKAGLGVAAAAFLVYANALSGTFHYDDFHSLVDNPHVRSLGQVPRYFVDPGAFSGDADKAMYRPLLLVSYALNYAVHGYDARGFLLVNIALHAACSALVWALGRGLVGPVAGLYAGLLFAVHPLAGEPVNYISSRSESLAALFYLASFLCYRRAADQGRVWRALSLAAFALGLLCKSVVLTLPAALLIFDLSRRGRLRGWRVYLPYGLLAALYLVLVVHNGFLGRSLERPVRGWAEQLMTQAKAPAYYAKLLFVPRGLNVEHQFFVSRDPGEAAVWTGLLLAGSLAYLAWRNRARLLPVFALAWAVVALLPATLMPLNMLVNERRLYLPMAAFSWVCGWLLERGPGRLLWLIVPLLAFLSWERNPLWRDDLTLWRDSVSRSPAMYRAQTNLGKALQLSGDWQGALDAYGRALEIDGRHGDAYNNIATIYHLRGEYEKAIPWYNRALERYPGYEEIYQNLADAHAQLGDLERAVSLYEKALALAPESGPVWSNYGQTLYRAGNGQGAERALLRAAELMPDQAEPYNNLGNIYADRGEGARALAMYEKALSLGVRERVQVLVNMGSTYRQLGALEEARRVLGEALELDPQSAAAHYQLGRVERRAGRQGEAMAALEAAGPNHAQAQAELGELLVEAGELERAGRALSQALEVDSLYSRAWYGLGSVRERQGREQEALAAYDRFLTLWSAVDGRRAEVEERVRRLRGRP